MDEALGPEEAWAWVPCCLLHSLRQHGPHGPQFPREEAVLVLVTPHGPRVVTQEAQALRRGLEAALPEG